MFLRKLRGHHYLNQATGKRPAESPAESKKVVAASVIKQ
jgi:hypothetical protein